MCLILTSYIFSDSISRKCHSVSLTHQAKVCQTIRPRIMTPPPPPLGTQSCDTPPALPMQAWNLASLPVHVCSFAPLKRSFVPATCLHPNTYGLDTSCTILGVHPSLLPSILALFQFPRSLTCIGKRFSITCVGSLLSSSITYPEHKYTGAGERRFSS